MWDQDGVLADWTGGFNPFCERPCEEEWQSWSHYKSWGWDTPTFLTKLDEFGTAGHFGRLKPLPDGVAGFQMLDRIGGVRQVVVTDKPNDRAFHDARAWLTDFNLFPEAIVRSADKTIVLAYADPGDVVYAIDDRVENVQALIDVGINAYLRDQPWNRHVDHLPRTPDAVAFARIVAVAARGNAS